MSTEEYITQLDRKLSALDKPDLILNAAAATHNMQLSRIFDTGVKASGKIGAYATTPMYADAKQFAKAGAFQPAGKLRLARTPTAKASSRPGVAANRNAVPAPGMFKNGKPRKSMFLQGGYQQLKSVQGLEASFVNLSYTADLRNDIAQSLSGNETGFCSGVSSATNAQKLQGLLAKYGDDLFALTDDEKQFFKTAVMQVINVTIS